MQIRTEVIPSAWRVSFISISAPELVLLLGGVSKGLLQLLGSCLLEVCICVPRRICGGPVLRLCSHPRQLLPLKGLILRRMQLTSAISYATHQ